MHVIIFCKQLFINILFFAVSLHIIHSSQTLAGKIITAQRPGALGRRQPSIQYDLCEYIYGITHYYWQLLSFFFWNRNMWIYQSKRKTDCTRQYIIITGLTCKINKRKQDKDFKDKASGMIWICYFQYTHKKYIHDFCKMRPK